MTVTRTEAESSPFSFSAKTRNSPQCHRLAAPIRRLVICSVVSTCTSSLGQIGSSSKNLKNNMQAGQGGADWTVNILTAHQVILAMGLAMKGTFSRITSS